MPAAYQPTGQSGTKNPSLRKQLRQRRRQLDHFTQRHNAIRLTHRINRSLTWRGSRRIAFYQAIDGEIDPAGLLKKAWAQGKICYLPVLHPFHPHRLVFVRVSRHSRLHRNRWGIAEPVPAVGRVASIKSLDLILVPLVGFDRQGHRLGMGKGFYDRALSFRAGRRFPRLIGLGHMCQESGETLRPAPWDVRMDQIATPRWSFGRLWPL
ncbi:MULTISPECIES: 5-formyltetrahydrofolate cyclo-ligase [unclassified Pseudohongiella]|uniref:5-formyltetrahydrofolate cyclo-ligase n=1 Tax=unclassified Pseudohongiella TaxID=2629611 RepID=UPI000C901D81|nr:MULTISPECIES: 5-formyltetrahydrofolate cyclo-ligase [unclassified Pseudohongiella]MAY55016.1 5-formyltetrahydrofolate cyclo-ligase [Gammaproteobacteria bacterium]HBN15501.1 5-formyltetrahydrofolate cyclo-ligase [Pseudohongiella sp.]|tara:strand:- start:941 stop:1567 length:627 start_codon:yes stop_codon:yes gene_type:complete